MNFIDQIFVLAKARIVSLAPESLRLVTSAIIDIAAIMAFFGLCFALTTLMERKILGRIQNRYGPNRVGPFGLLQPIADGLKMLTKEDIVPDEADRAVHFLAPFVLTIPIWLAFAVLPIGRNMCALDLDAGVLFLLATGVGTELAVFMAGWSSRNKYSLVGAMRAVAQMISYEVPLLLSVVPVLMLAGTLSLNKIVEAQTTAWYVFTPCGLAAFALFMAAASAESNRSPFDLPEAESEIIAGYLTEYSGFKYALFFLGEYISLFAICGLAVTLFLGGWRVPFVPGAPSWAVFFVKFCLLLLFFIWMRGTVPRLRLDQLLALSWKFFTPMALLNIICAAQWYFSRDWNFIGAWGVRWLLNALLIGVPGFFLGRFLTNGRFARRSYRYAS